jgi:hypothetical protein
VAREDRWGSGFEQAGAKTGAPGSEPERPAADLEHTQPMEGTVNLEADPSEDTAYIGAPLPRIEQIPSGIIVKEDVMGRATGQWIVQIRCECGRRWFDVKMVKTARCPRCENMVVVAPIE